MKLHRQRDELHNIIHAYGPQGIVIGGVTHGSAVLVAPDWLESPWGPMRMEDLRPEHFARFHGTAPQILLLGTGSRQRFPDRALLCALRERNLHPEIMDTSAACRTYNILVGEDRDVVAALLPPSA
ncbi:Mth938-like domain-containing protein [Acidithiobacillus sulfuriphilus]|uniref:Mth938-like domain-containing protein n=1 Tax=Acidithiobacillus sulfuriphilus TaxID=1867749 RepID=UPI003F61922B